MSWRRVLKSIQALAAHTLLFSFTLLLVLKLDHTVSSSWWFVSTPLCLSNLLIQHALESLNCLKFGAWINLNMCSISIFILDGQQSLTRLKFWGPFFVCLPVELRLCLSREYKVSVFFFFFGFEKIESQFLFPLNLRSYVSVYGGWLYVGRCFCRCGLFMQLLREEGSPFLLLLLLVTVMYAPFFFFLYAYLF